MTKTPPTFPEDFGVVNLKGNINTRYYSFKINNYEIIIREEFWLKYTVGLYKNLGLLEPRIGNLYEKHEIQEAINKMFLLIPNF